MIPVITIDGPAGTGKGTLAALLAEHLGWHLLDSGALYRVLALAAMQRGINFADLQALTKFAAQLIVNFSARRTFWEKKDVSVAIRTEEIGMAASQLAAYPQIRSALLNWQRAWLQEPGGVADGRDLGTVVFPQARLKIFLDASAEIRTERRYKQLIEQGLSVNLATLNADLQQRDARDRARAIAPLCAASDAIQLDTTMLSINEVFDLVLTEVQRVFSKNI